MWQAHYVADRIREADPDRAVELVPVSTIGDRDRTEPLHQMGGQGVFTREVQRVVLDDRADVAVHSLKDLPTEPVEGLALAGIPSRYPRWDALVLPASSTASSGDVTILDEPVLPIEFVAEGAIVGTGSLRRQAQLLHVRPDLEMREIRGNVETRLKKLDAGEYDAIILAEAGLKRLGFAERISALLMAPLMYPAVGQAALGIECRADDSDIMDLLARISDPQTGAEVLAERACLATLRAGCHAPVGVLTQVLPSSPESAEAASEGRELILEAVVLSPDGKERFHASVTGPAADPQRLGVEAARRLLDQGASRVL
jgi:hydroxymethylbilane synthase